MEIWLGHFLSKNFINILPAVSLIIVGLIVEKNYVSRIAIFSNAVALSSYFAFIPNLSFGLILYINILTIAGILAIFSYLVHFSLPKEFYFFAGAFCSAISGMILLGAIL